MSSPATLEASTDSGYAAGSNADYATARDTAGGGHAHGAIGIGQRLSAGNYTCKEGYVQFDTGTELPDTATVTVATFKLYGSSSSHDTDSVINVAAFDWGAAVDNTDFRTAAQLSGLTVLATFNIADTWSTAGYNTFTNSGDGSAMLAAINKTGITRFILYSNLHAAGTAPSGDEDIGAYGYDDATRKPQLYLEYTVPSSGKPLHLYRHHSIPSLGGPYG